ncbi:LRR and PYD domains-containing 6-like protein [Labeo rohita]|uniref:LRR and PYD domains-containing 6-like protein n=1 Tax=Labeo rohita TaxID=84645 RepID=A0A498N1M7_LABRO|nr:LRR and PYD domains-containing 6-like protein [Labeo rohita]
MVAHFGPEETVKITVEILRKMKQNLLATHVENTHKEGLNAEGNKADLHDYRKISLKLKNKLQQDYKRILVDTVDKMVDCFGPEEAVKITVKILRKMNQNHLAEQLENKYKEVKYYTDGTADFYSTVPASILDHYKSDHLDHVHY